MIFILKKLKLLRDEAGISQQALANAIGVSQQSVNKYENHKIEPDIDTLIRIADYFETSVDYLIGHTDIRRKLERVSPHELNESESTLISCYRRLNPKQRAAIHTLIKSYYE